MDGVLEPIAVTVIGGLVLAGVLGAIGWAYRNHRSLARVERQVDKLTLITMELIESTDPEQRKKLLVEWLDKD